MGKRVAICCHGQVGDIMTAMSVLKYKNELWGSDCKVVWFASKENWDIFKHSHIEVREFPRGFGYPEMVVEENRKLIEKGELPVWEDWKPLVDENNHLNLELAKNVPSLSEFDFGYFPAPHQVPHNKRLNVDYPNVSRKVFGLPNNYEWHPVLEFSDEEKIKADEYMTKLPSGKIIFWETFAGSGQTFLTEEMVERGMWICREYWKGCNFIFGSHKFLSGNEQFPQGFFERNGVYSCSDFTARQTALISGRCDLILSVSSGLCVAASCWGNNPVPIIQAAGSFICSTQSLALGKFELVTSEHKSYETAKDDFYLALINHLTENK